MSAIIEALGDLEAEIKTGTRRALVCGFVTGAIFVAVIALLPSVVIIRKLSRRLDSQIDMTRNARLTAILQATELRTLRQQKQMMITNETAERIHASWSNDFLIIRIRQ